MIDAEEVFSNVHQSQIKLETMTYLGIALLCFAIVPGSFSNDDIHKYMTPEEVQQVFNTDHDSVPKYEIAKVHWSGRLHKRDIPEQNKIHIRAFGEDINLWLYPGESILAGEETSVYYAKYSPRRPNGVEYMRRDGLMAMVGRIFEDPNTLASLVIGTEDSGRTRVNGNIQSKKFAVRSLPPRVAEEYRRRRRAVGDSDDLDSPHHIIFKTSDSYDGNYSELPMHAIGQRQKASQYVSGIPDTLYPELLIVVEYSMNKAYGRNIYGLLQYLLAFWNGVDLKYRSLESPKVRLHISGIIIAEDYRATPYISNHSLGENVFNSSAVMSNYAEFFGAVRDEFPTVNYDIVVTMTRQVFGIGGNSGVLGLAYIGTACTHENGNWPSIVLVRDDDAFRNVLAAAHELGHSLGSLDDSVNSGCTLEDGHIMVSTPLYTNNSSDFSSCSIRSFNTELKTGKLDCLFNKPEAPGKSLPRLMPGRMKSLEEQCKGVDMASPCESPDVCVNMYCLNESGSCVESGVGANDGTSCGDNKFCLHMECVSL